MQRTWDEIYGVEEGLLDEFQIREAWVRQSQRFEGAEKVPRRMLVESIEVGAISGYIHAY